MIPRGAALEAPSLSASELWPETSDIRSPSARRPLVTVLQNSVPVAGPGARGMFARRLSVGLASRLARRLVVGLATPLG
eukprot:836805-Prymnesium_polylepis.1